MAVHFAPAGAFCPTRTERQNDSKPTEMTAVFRLEARLARHGGADHPIRLEIRQSGVVV